jgi:hypothetical protein
MSGRSGVALGAKMDDEAKVGPGRADADAGADVTVAGADSWTKVGPRGSVVAGLDAAAGAAPDVRGPRPSESVDVDDALASMTPGANELTPALPADLRGRRGFVRLGGETSGKSLSRACSCRISS